MIWIVCLYLVVSIVSAQESCTHFKTCPQPNPNHITVHILCHSHQDVGWVKTEDEYYDHDVSAILTSVVDNLKQNSRRKFIISEIAFMSRWYKEQSNVTQLLVKELVQNGQIEFVGGGWVQNDEAITHYSALIDQITMGMEWIEHTFGPCARPKSGWQIDPFGHSRIQAYILENMQFEGLFIGRIDYQDKLRRIREKKMEVLWKTEANSNKELFTVVLPNVYWPPPGFCFDIFCSDSLDFLERKTRDFIQLIGLETQKYKTKNVIMTMGSDFTYSDARRWYENLDRLMDYINSKPDLNITVTYSTPDCYLKAVHSTNISWPGMRSVEDFLPYSSTMWDYWTGYYTSRPAFKYLARYSNGFLQACKQVSTLFGFSSEDYRQLKRIVAVIQHHDAITGTEQEYVKNDYVRSLSKGLAECELVFKRAFHLLNSSSQSHPEISFCHLLNISECLPITKQYFKFNIVLYNPLAFDISVYYKLPIPSTFEDIKCFDKHRSQIECQVIPIPNSILSMSWRNDTSNREVVFKANLPPMSFNAYYFDNLPVIPDQYNAASVTSIENEYFELRLAFETGLIKEIRLKNGQTIPLKQSFYWYEPQMHLIHEKPSGAYIFNPVYMNPFAIEDEVTFRIVKGDLVEEIHQTFNPWLSQVIRLYKGVQHVEFDWVVGPIPYLTSRGKEIIIKFSSDLESGSVFYTDLNGKDEIRRIKNYRPGWNLNVTQEVSGNYYPVTSWIAIKDPNRDLTMSVLNDRAQGGSSLSSGSIELMIHRRLIFDDGLGVNEALNEPGKDGHGLVVQGKHYLFLGPISTTKKLVQATALRKMYHPVMFVQNSDTPLNISRIDLTSIGSNLHVLTLEPLNGTAFLLRVENFLSSAESGAEFETFSIQKLFPLLSITHAVETDLTGLLRQPSCNTLNWRNLEFENESPCVPSINNLDLDSIQIASNSIRTFVVFHDPR